ncbi:MAG: 2-oxoacid:acceptor oxidoreductase family protein [Anaerolineales bacterium]|nr:2-oxoacid:acceptor oxidoreductase family protein [Anaerolineales bacterium]
MSEPGDFTYLDESALPYPFCPGCGHGAIVDQLNAALLRLQIDPRKLVIVTDIGCAGLSDRFFQTNAFHGLHGRSVTYATGIKLQNPELKVIVLIGDGGCGIGGNHLVHAARRNIGVSVLVFNNLNYGMTGGEHSATTPEGAITATTRYGNLERPMDICGTAAVNGASFVARTTSFDKSLPDLIVQAIQNEGFSLIDIWELCAAYFAPTNRFNKRLLEETLDSLGFATGILHLDERPEYARAYRQATADQLGEPSMAGQPLATKYRHHLKNRLDCLIAGAAGQKIGTAAAAFARGAVLSGLWATQRDDYPVTVRSGHSISEVILSPQEIRFLGTPKPGLVVALFEEGLKKIRPRLGQLDEADRLYINAELLPVETRAQVAPLNLHGQGRKKHWSLMAMAAALRHSGIYPLEAFQEAVALNKAFAEENLAAVAASEGLIIEM